MNDLPAVRQRKYREALTESRSRFDTDAIDFVIDVGLLSPTGDFEIDIAILNLTLNEIRECYNRHLANEIPVDTAETMECVY